MQYKLTCEKKRQPKRTWFDGMKEAMEKKGIEGRVEPRQIQKERNLTKWKTTSDAKNHRLIDDEEIRDLRTSGVS